MNLLTLKNISAFYGPSQALFGVSMTIAEGEVVALMGRNGMGKSTTIKVICRLLNNQSGSISFAGEDTSALPSYLVARLGIGLVPEGRRCFASLTVYENLMASAISGFWNFERVCSLFPRLRERKNQFADTLSGGEQQMLSISRALMTNPRLLILDEATEGLAPVIRQEIWRSISELKDSSGLAILIVDKTIQELAQVADKAVILERGKSVWEAPFSALTDDITDRFMGVS